MTLPNVITALRIVLIPLFVFFLLKGILGVAAALFLWLALSDGVDGFLARYLKQTTDLGKFLDPLADKILVTTALIGLTALNKSLAIPVMLIVAREFIVSGIRISAASRGKILAASQLAKWKTVSQIIAVLMLILNLPFANGMLWFAVLLSIVSAVEYASLGG